MWKVSLLLIVIFASEVTFVHASPAYAVELISFTASGLPTGVELRWETATELGASAFLLQRAQGGSYQDLTQLVDENGQPYPGGVIEAEGSPTFGSTYIARDLTAVPGQSYAYQLLEVESDNNISVIASTTVLAGATPSPTPLSIGSNNTPQPGTQNTSTPTVVATAVPTNPVATLQPTATVARTFITPTPATVNDQLAAPANAPSAPANSPNNGNNGSSNASQPVASAPTDTGIVEVAQTTPESGYPGQATESETESSYPEAVVTPLTIGATETPYPANAFNQEQQPTPTIIGVIGSQPNQNNGSSAESNTDAGQTASPDSSTGILWLGFLGGLLIFGAAVAGSIALFVRRRQ